MPRIILILLALTILWSARPLCAAPAISNVICPASAAMYDKLEMTFDVTTVATNLYWPYDAAPAANVAPHTTAVPAGVGVSVDGLFLPPGETNWNNAIVQPGFCYQPYTYDLDHALSNGRDWLYPDGSPEWKIRFAPTSAGTWQYKIRVTDSGGTTTTAAEDMGSFTCDTGTNHGFVKVSATDSRYFELNDGTYLPMIGLNASASNVTGFESEYAKLQSMGVNLVRSWWQSSNSRMALFGAGGQGGDQNWAGLVVSAEEVRPGHLVSAKMTSNDGTRKTVFATVPVKPSSAYIFSAWVKTVALTGTGDFGFRLEAFPYKTAVPMARVIGDTEWHQVFYSFTTTSTQYEVTWANLELSGVTGGAAYVTDVSMRENLGGGNYGPELLMRTDFQIHTGYPQQIAWTIDKQLETAAQYGVYVKAVIEEKKDSYMARILADGSFDDVPVSSLVDENNVYASATHACRTYQTYYWRYLIARYGYSTALHSVEFVNEGNPSSGNHQSAVEALGTYFRAHDPNKHMVSTSNWHSFPPTMWNRAAIDYADLHMYMGWAVAGGGNRLWPGWDGNWSQGNTNAALGTGWEIDDTEVYSGNNSLKVTVLANNTLQSSKLLFNCGAIPGHKYKISWMAKATNILVPGNDSRFTFLNPTPIVVYSEGGGDWQGNPLWMLPGGVGSIGRYGIPSGTYGWTPIETPEFTVPADTTTSKIRLMTIGLESLQGNSTDAGTGYAWFDDFRVTDVTTGEVLNYNGGFEYMDSMSYDVVAGHSSYSQLTHSFGFNKPTIRGEVGLTHPLRFTDPYKGFPYQGDDQLLIDDTVGIWWKKWTWANIHPGGLTEIYWFYQVLLHPDYGGQYPKYGKAYQDFMADVFLSNGHYVDAGVTTIAPNLRVLGQKDLTNNKAHLWFDNAKHTWKNVVDGVAIPAVSGTVTVTGLADGPYKVEWWDTSTGVITSTDSVQCTSGSISLVISGLATDKACKIYVDDASPPSGSININGGDALTTSTLVTLLLSAIDADSGVSMMRFSNDSSIWSYWETYSTSKAWNITEGDGVRTVYVQYMNGGQIPSLVYNDTILSDVTPPSGTITINSGAASTVSTAVTLTLAATDATSGVAQMRFSNDNSTWSTWESYVTGKSWTLPTGDGTKTVYAQYMDSVGNVSISYSDSIVLSLPMPTGSVSANSGAAYTGSTSVTLTVSDAGGGAVQMRFSNDGTTWSTWQTYATSKAWVLTTGAGTKTAYAQYKNSYGTSSTPCTDSIILDTGLPTGAISINAGAQYANSTSVTVTASVSDTGSGLSEMRFSNNGTTWSTWETYASSKSWSLTSGSGSKTVYAQFKDAVGNTSSSLTDTITLDTVAPTGTVNINSGAASTGSTAVTLTLAATDATSGVAQMRFSNDNSTWSTYQTYATSTAWILASGDSTKTIYAQFKDGAGTTSASFTDTITLDTTLPTGTLVINGGAASTNTASVTLTLSAADAGSGVSRMRFSNDGTTWTSWESYAASKAWGLVSGDGTKTVYVQFEDGVGNVSISYSDSIVLSVTMPVGSVLANAGAVYTSSTSVTLVLSDGGGGAVQMRFSGDGTSWSTWQTYATSKSWTLSSGDGAKTVYAQFKNSVGTSSSPCNDVIILDTSLPTGAISINAGTPYTNSASVTVTISVSDTGSGLSQMRFSNDGTTWSTWEADASSKSWALTSGNGSRTVYAQFKDAIGNTSSSLTDAITLDTVQPTGTVTINSGATYAPSTSVTLTLSASDSGSAVAQKRFSNDGATWTSWESYGTSKSWTLASGDGTKTVYVQYKDGAGNSSQNCTDTIILDSSGPTGAITINAGDEYVKTASVTLTLSASGGLASVTDMRFSNDGTIWGVWLTYAAGKSWNLSSGDGTKVVYVQYRDEIGRTSPTYADTIILDTSAPTIAITFPTSSADYYSNHPSLAVRGTAAADVTSLTWATDGGASGDCSGASSWATQAIALTEGANVITITAWDAAGNSVTKSITLHRVNAHPPNTWVDFMMVSIPLIPDEPDPKVAVGFDGGAWCIFRPIQNNYVIWRDDPQHLTWLTPAANTPGRGFWARFVNPATTPLGEIPDQTQPATIHLFPGWNIIGTPFLSPVTWDVMRITATEVGGVQKTLANSRSVLDDFAFGWRQSGGVGAYYVVYDSNLSPGIDNTLEPWMAYWILVYRECDLTFPAPPIIP